MFKLVKNKLLKIFKYVKKYYKLFWQLLIIDIIFSKQEFKDGFINTIIWTSFSIFIFTYIFPILGLKKSFGAFMFAGAFANWSLIRIFPFAAKFISDITSNNPLSYYLTIPIPSNLIFIKIIIIIAINSMFLTLPIIPLGKVILGNQLNFVNFSLTKFIPMFIVLNVFVGSLSLVLVSIVRNIHNIGKVFLRFIFPMWIFGGASFTWQTIYNIDHNLGYIFIINPFLYAIEGTRYSILGSNDYLQFQLCLILTILFAFIFGYIGIRQFKKRLDFI